MDNTTHLNPMMMQNLCRQSLAEDIGSGDVTTSSLIPDSIDVTANIVTCELCTVAGLPVVRQVFSELNSSIKFDSFISDGQQCNQGQKLATVSGSAQAILRGERTALNFLQHLSGIATLTKTFVNALGNSKTKILDTRKTTPGLRMLEKYAVLKGGGINHRFGLYDRVMIKDNHLFICSVANLGGIKKAVEKSKENHPDLEIEVEIESLEQMAEALEAKADYILLDNMSVSEMIEAVKLKEKIYSTVLLEASGGITLEKISEIAHIGLDFISVGAITHSARSIDIGLDFDEVENYPSAPE